MNQITQLRQLIRESIQEYIREIDEAGNRAALEAKMAKTQEAIDLRKKKLNMEGLDEAYHDMMDKGKMKEMTSEIKLLEKSMTKYQKMLEKMDAKNAPKMEEMKDDKVEEEVIDEVSIDESESENEEEERYDENGKPDPNGQYDAGANYIGPKMEESMDVYEMLLMQKRAGIISETEYKAKVEEAKKKMTAAQKEKKEDIVKGMKKSKSFGKSKKEKSKMYATATKLATKKTKSLKEEVQALFEDDLNEKMSYDDFEQMIKPFLDLAKSKGWVWNSSGDSWFDIPSPAIALYHSTELPTTADGEYKGQKMLASKDVTIGNQVQTYRGNIEKKQGDVIMQPDYGMNQAYFQSKDKAILDAIKASMANSTDVVQDAKELSSQLTSSKDFEPVKYYSMILRKKA
jgi:hypothetical protein